MTMIGMSKTWLHKDAESDQQIKEFIPFPFVFFSPMLHVFPETQTGFPHGESRVDFRVTGDWKTSEGSLGQLHSTGRTA